MERREFLQRVGAAGAAVGLAGCILTGDQTFSSDPIRIPKAAARAAGYEEQTVKQITKSETIKVQGQERTITANGWVSSYRKGDIADNRAAEVILVSTPNPTVAGQSLNPLLKGSTEELLRQYAEQNSQITIERELGETTQTMLDDDRTFEGFEISARQGGAELRIEAQVARFSHKEDAILVFALYPAVTADVERETAFDMLADATHPADPPSDATTSESTN